MILDAIFQGTFSVESFSCPKDPEYKELTRSVEELSIKVKELLGTENSKLLDDLLNKVYASQYMEAKAFFKAGFAAGIDLHNDVVKELISLEKNNS